MLETTQILKTSFSHIDEHFDLSPLDFDLREDVFEQLKRKLFETPIEVKEALEQFQPQADRYQEEVINSQERIIRVVAPAGSGKTQTMINRVLLRIREGISAERILILTFDKAASKSVQDKLNEQYDTISLDVKQPTIMTLNAFGYNLLREHVKEEYFNIIPRYRQHKILNNSINNLQNKYPTLFKALPKNLKQNYYLELFSLLKNELFDPFEVSAQSLADFILNRDELLPFIETSTTDTSAKKILQAIIWLFQYFNHMLREQKLMDFDDQKLRAYKILKTNPDLRHLIQNQFDEIIVDEFQDINRLDFEFIKLIAQKAVLVVTGDDDQAIYGFRGCSPEYIMNLEKHLGQPVYSYELSINYRCPSNIVHHADRLIQHNNFRIEKMPIAHNKDIATISVVSSISPAVEAKLISEQIRRIKKANFGLKFSDFAVLYRTNAQSLPLQVDFILKNIPYHVRNEDNILENESLDLVLAVLKLQQSIQSTKQPSPTIAAKSIKAYFKYLPTIKVVQLEKLFSSYSDFCRVIESSDFGLITPQHNQERLIQVFSSVFSTKNLLDSLEILSKNFKGLHSMIGSLEDMHQKRVGLGEIFDIANDFKGNTEDFIQMISLAIEKARNTNAGKDEGGVSLRTFFRAKGLQWHTVFLTTCNEGVIPHKRAPIEDERRLFYVGMTRASSNLMISYVDSVCNNKVKPSQFLIQAGVW